MSWGKYCKFHSAKLMKGLPIRCYTNFRLSLVLKKMKCKWLVRTFGKY